MLHHRRYVELGKANYGWLQARYHFSFAEYHDDRFMGHGALRVINDDRIAPNTGFAPHGHRNMEIITFVRHGAISHEDNLGNKGRTTAGTLQVMSAGTGIRHAEWNRESEETRLYQIWIEPKSRGIAPRWDMRDFPASPIAGALPVLASGLPEHAGQALYIHQDAVIAGGRMPADTSLTYRLRGLGYLLVSQGTVRVDAVPLHAGDGAAFALGESLSLSASTDAEIVVIDVPPA